MPREPKEAAHEPPHMRSLLTITGFAVAALLSGCRKEVPVAHRLADCTNNTLRFQMTVREFPPYQFGKRSVSPLVSGGG